MMKILLIFSFLWLTLSTQASPLLNTNENIALTYTDFVTKVEDIYKGLIFNNAKLTINKVGLCRISSGIAYAFFDRKTNKRYILLNYGFLYQKYKTIALTDPTKAINLIRTIIAHEWAHHYLAHIFEGKSTINERNADIVAGRILAQNKVDETSINEVTTLFDKHQDAQHLGALVRNDLILKGYLTEKLIKADFVKKEINDAFKDVDSTLRISDINNLNEKYKKETIEHKQRQNQILKDLKEKLILRIENYFNNATDTVKSKYSVRYIAVDSLVNSIDSVRPSLTLIPDLLVTNINLNYDMIKDYNETVDKIIQINKKTTTYTDSLKVKLEAEKNTVNKLSINLDDLLNKIPKMGQKLKESHIEVLESLYTLFFINQYKINESKLKNNTKDEHELLPIKSAVLKFFEDDMHIKDNIYKYTLKGKVHLTFDKNTAKLTVNGITSKQCTKGCSTINKDCFPYTFITKTGLFFIDFNNHLWTETPGAEPIDDKIFLQRHELIRP